MWHLVETNDSWRSLIQRVGLAVVFAPHAAQQAFGMFGGTGFENTAHMLAQSTHMPDWVGVLAVLAQVIGVPLLFFGFLTRLGALGITGVMVAAIAFVHADNGFFMNWYGKQAGEGYEFHILALLIAVPLIFSGGGRWSIDRGIAWRHTHHHAV
jgi:putative oxidoreductase